MNDENEYGITQEQVVTSSFIVSMKKNLLQWQLNEWTVNTSSPNIHIDVTVNQYPLYVDEYTTTRRTTMIT